MHYNREKGKYIFDNWTEYFRIDVEEGCVTPAFFIPVKRKYPANIMVCWIFILAPLMLVIYLIQGMLNSLWTDLRQTAHDINRMAKYKNYIRKHDNQSGESDEQKERRSLISVRFL
jgi:hypothetical protein